MSNAAKHLVISFNLALCEAVCAASLPAFFTGVEETATDAWLEHPAPMAHRSLYTGHTVLANIWHCETLDGKDSVLMRSEK